MNLTYLRAWPEIEPAVNQDFLAAPGFAYLNHVIKKQSTTYTDKPPKKAYGVNATKPIPNRNGPNAAIAETHPITPPACRGSKIIGICLNVDAFPIPAKKKIAIIP